MARFLGGNHMLYVGVVLVDYDASDTPLTAPAIVDTV
jgi:hypothetical protein